VLALGLALSQPYLAYTLWADIPLMGQLISQGVVPYRDVYEDRAPGSFYLTALTFRLFGDSPAIARGQSQVLVFFSALLLFGLTNCLWGRRAAWGALIFWAVWQPLFLGSLVHFEIFLLPLLLLTGRVLWQSAFGRGQLRLWNGLTGVLLAMLTLFKQNMVFAWLLAPLWRYGVGGGETRRERWGHVGLMALGCALLMGGSLAYYGAVGGLQEYVYGNLIFELTIVPQERTEWPTYEEFAFLVRVFIWLFPALLLVGEAFRQRRQREVAAGTLMLGMGIVGAVPAYKFYDHFYLQAAVPWAGMAFGYVWSSLFGTSATLPVSQQRLRRGLLLGLLVMTLYPIPGLYRQKFHPDPADFPPEFYAESGAVTEITSPLEPIYVFGLRPEIYYLSRRRPATRYTTLQHYHARIPGIQEEIIRSLEQVQPRIVVCYEDDRSPQGYALRIYARQILEYLRANYTEFARPTERCALWRRRGT